MLAAIRKSIVLPRISTTWLLSGVTILAFGWLLVNDLIRPLAILLLQLYLAF